MRSSCSVMSCGVPSVAIVVKSSRATARRLTSPQWIAGIYLGAGGGALAFIQWVMALQRTTPTRVASTMTVNPIAAALLASPLVGEPIRQDRTSSHRRATTESESLAHTPISWFTCRSAPRAKGRADAL